MESKSFGGFIKNTFGGLVMKKGKLIAYFIFFMLAVTELHAKETLKWGMDSKKIKKKGKIEKIYQNYFCEILYLPKNSVFQNEYDECLLFSRDEGLISRLQKTDKNFESLLEENTQNNTKFEAVQKGISHVFIYEGELVEVKFDSNYFNERKSFLKPFPEANSFEVFALMMGFCDYIQKPYKNDFGEYESKGLVNFDGDGYISLQYAHNTYWNRFSSAHTFFNKNEVAISEILVPFVKSADAALEAQQKKDRELAYKKNPGPFGTWWEMNEKDLQYILTEKKKLSSKDTDIDDLNEKIGDYSSKYSLFKYTGSSIIKEFYPQKSVDLVSRYFAVFNAGKDLYQVFAVANHSRALTKKDIITYEKKNEMSFQELKTWLTELYGTPKEKNEKSVYWISEKGIKIELFSEDRLVKLYSMWDGKEYGGWDYYTCLVYTDMAKYRELLSAEKKALKKKEQEEADAARKKEEEQKSFF